MVQLAKAEGEAARRPCRVGCYCQSDMRSLSWHRAGLSIARTTRSCTNYSDASGEATAKSFTDVGTPSPRKLFGAGEAATNILE